MSHLELSHAELWQMYIKLEAENKRLRDRDLNATIELCYDNGDNPFAREELKVLDVGVADNCYVVESEVLKKALAENKRLKEDMEHICEYWNGDRNDGAMHDALCHILEIAENAAMGGVK